MNATATALGVVALLAAGGVPHATPGLPAAPERSASPPRVCGRGGWCARGPLATSLTGVWSVAPDDVWAVGHDGTLMHFDGRQWTLRDDARGEDFQGVWGSGPTDGWAVGGRQTRAGWAGALFRWDGRTWSRFSTLEGARPIEVGGTGPADVWVLQEDGTLTHWDGQRLGAPMAGPGHVRAVAFSEAAPDDLWLATETALWRRKAGRWSKVKSPARGPAAILASAAGDLWLADHGGQIHHRAAGGAWQSWRVGSPQQSAALASAGGALWYASGPAIHRWDGARWLDSRRDGDSSNIYALAARPTGQAWAVGAQGTLLAWSGERWTAAGDPGGLRGGLAVWGTADDDVWVARRDPVALSHWNGGVWTTTSPPDAGELNAVWGTGPDDVWAVGDVILHWDGQAWSRTPALLWFTLEDVWGSGPADVWAAGRDGLLHWDGCRWDSAEAERDGHFDGGVALSSTEAFVLRSGSIRRWDGRRWTDDSLPGHRPASALGAAPPNAVLAVNGDGTYRRETSGWKPIGGSPGPGMVRLFARGDAMWARAANGTLARWDGRTWAVRDVPFDVEGLGLWVSPSGSPWLSGARDGVVVSGPPEPHPAVGRVPVPSRARAVRPCPDTPDAIALSLAHAAEPLAAGRSVPSPVAAVNTVQNWLAGVGGGDPIRVAETSALPFSIAGLTTDYGPRWNRCGGPARPGALERTHAFHDPGLSLRVGDERAFRDLLGCLLADTMLSDTIPRPSQNRPDAGGRQANVEVTTVAQLSPRLARFKRELAAVRSAHLLVQATSTDGRGITVTAGFVVAGDDANCRVASVYLDELFEE